MHEQSYEHRQTSVLQHTETDRTRMEQCSRKAAVWKPVFALCQIERCRSATEWKKRVNDGVILSCPWQEELKGRLTERRPSLSVLQQSLPPVEAVIGTMS